MEEKIILFIVFWVIVGLVIWAYRRFPIFDDKAVLENFQKEIEKEFK